jgi:hypothetical protein
MRSVLSAFCAIGLLWAASTKAESNVPDAMASKCAELKDADFTTVQDAPTQLLEVRSVAAAGELPAHCRVRGYVAPNVGFVLKLPEQSAWNGKFAHMAPGGYGGSAEVMSPWCDDALRRGYACISQDTGHVGAGSDGTWAYNNLQAEFDYGIRAANVATLAGKAVTQHFYTAPPKYSYFMGCSGGGKQALVQAQRYPWNFDGVIAVEPSNPTITGVVQLWNALATHDSSGKPLFKTADLQLLHDHAVAQCDLLDGIKDGVIGGDPRRCKVDPGQLACRSGQSSGCLSPRQVEAARKIYGGPVTSTGKKLYFPATPGGEMGTYITGGRTGIDYKRQYWQYMGFTPDPGPSWKPTDFDFDNDWKRSYMMDAVLVASDNPDLRKLRAEGHKLMVVQGWEDSGLPGPQVSVDYYEMVEKLLGGREQTQEHVRLFMIPGRSHCRGGVGAAAIDMLHYMEQWVEKGQAPDVMIGAHIVENRVPSYPKLLADYNRLPDDPALIKFTRPHYPYPLYARYKGAGDPNDYRSFEPAEPDHE